MNKVRRFANASSAQDCSPKIQEAVKLLQTSPGPAMLYSFWISMGVKLVSRCLHEEKAHGAVRVVTGSTSNSQLKKIMQAFNEDQSVRTLLFSSAASEGLSTKHVQRFIVLEPQWQRLAEYQAIGRAVRINSHLTHDQPEVHVYYLMSHSDTNDLVNVDEHMFAYNRDKYKKMLTIMGVMRQASIPMSVTDMVDISFSPTELEKAVQVGLVEKIQTTRRGTFRTEELSPRTVHPRKNKRKKKPGVYRSETAVVRPEAASSGDKNAKWKCAVM
jgi:hypothetical protein